MGGHIRSVPGQTQLSSSSIHVYLALCSFSIISELPIFSCTYGGFIVWRFIGASTDKLALRCVSVYQFKSCNLQGCATVNPNSLN